jgi:copper transport protein
MSRHVLRAVVAILALLSLAPPASAHTRLSASIPANGQQVAVATDEVVLTFSTDVAKTLQQVRVVDPDGDDIAGDPAVDGRKVVVPIDVDASGTYSVGWRTLGADGHPIKGSFAFTVTESAPRARDEPITDASPPPAEPTPKAAPHAGHEVLGSYPSDPIERVGDLARLLFYLSLLLVIGSAFFASLIAPGWRPRWFRRSAIMLVVSSLVVFGTNLALAGEYSIWGVINPWNAVPYATTPVGRVSIASAIGGLLLLRGYRGLREAVRTQNTAARQRFALTAIAVGILPALGGHAVSSDLPAVRIPADMLHLVAASIWFGGIMQLKGVAGATYADHPAVYPAVQRFAKAAFASVAVLVATGAIASVIEIGFDAGELFGTTYGRLVLAKIVLLGLTIPLAKVNQQRHVPALEGKTRRASADLRRYVFFEILLVATIVSITSWLVYEMPPKQSHDTGSHVGMNHAT